MAERRGKKTHDRRTLFRDEVVYRLHVDERGQSAHVGCGYMLKPGVDGGYRDRLLRTLVVVMVLRGSGVFTDWQGKDHALKAGSMIVLPPGRRHSVMQSPDGQWAEFFITLPAELWQALRLMQLLPAEGGHYPTPFRSGQSYAMEQLLSLMRSAPEGQYAPVWAQAIQILSQRMQAHQQLEVVPSRMSQLMHDANRQLADQPHRRVSLPALAASLGLSYESFRKQFQKEMGVSPGEMRIRHRMDLARQLLAEHHLSVKEVAYRLGYADPFTFSKQFRQYAGQSPSACRA